MFAPKYLQKNHAEQGRNYRNAHIFGAQSNKSLLYVVNINKVHSINLLILAVSRLAREWIEIGAVAASSDGGYGLSPRARVDSPCVLLLSFSFPPNLFCNM